MLSGGWFVRFLFPVLPANPNQYLWIYVYSHFCPNSNTSLKRRKVMNGPNLGSYNVSNTWKNHHGDVSQTCSSSRLQDNTSLSKSDGMGQERNLVTQRRDVTWLTSRVAGLVLTEFNICWMSSQLSIIMSCVDLVLSVNFFCVCVCVFFFVYWKSQIRSHLWASWFRVNERDL